MTITYATPRASFIVLATDGGTTSSEGGQLSLTEGALKMHVAKDRPLAVAAYGMARIDGRPLLDLVSGVLDVLPDTDSRSIGVALLQQLGPRISAARTAANAVGEMPVGCGFVIAQFREGGGDLRFADLEGAPGVETPVVRATSRGGRLGYPVCLGDFVRLEFSSEESRGGAISRRDKLRLKALEVVARCVEHERTLHDGRNLHCGFPVSVAVIDRSGVDVRSIVRAE